MCERVRISVTIELDARQSIAKKKRKNLIFMASVCLLLREELLFCVMHYFVLLFFFRDQHDRYRKAGQDPVLQVVVS